MSKLLIYLLVLFCMTMKGSNVFATQIVAKGNIIDNDLGVEGTVYHQGDVSFTILESQNCYQKSKFNGQVEEIVNGLIIDLIIKKIIINKLIIDFPPELPPFLAAITDEVFSADFTVNDPTFSFSGHYDRTPMLFDVDYEAIFEVGYPELTGNYTAIGITTPNGYGSALENATIKAELKSGGFYEFSIATNITFDSSIKLQHVEKASLFENITKQGDTYIFNGEVEVSCVPEPSSLVLLCFALAALAGFKRKWNNSKVNY